jgi:hypothetical protein
MARQMTATQLNKAAKAELLKLENGEAKYNKLVEYSGFLKDITHFDGPKFNQSTVGLLIKKNDVVSLSELVRKLKYPFMTGIQHFDEQTTKNARQKLEKVLAVIPPNINVQDLDTPFVYELPTKPVVSAPVLSEVSADTIRSELSQLQRLILSALYALLTGTGVTTIATKCDNQQQEWIQATIEQVRSGEIPATQNQETHRAFQHCRNSHGCHSCRSICAILTICRFGGNPEIDKQISRSVWYGSPFAEQAMSRLLIQTLGPTCALAQVVGNPESPHREMLVQILREMNVQETEQERNLRQQEDETNKQSEHAEYKKHAEVERLADIDFRKADLAEYERGYDISEIPAAYL